MLFLMKKQVAVVLTLGALLSAGTAKAVWLPNKATTSAATALVVGYLYHRKVDVVAKDKNVLTKTFDAGSELVHKVVDCPKVKAAVVAVAAGAAVYHHQAIIDALKGFVAEALKGSSPKQP